MFLSAILLVRQMQTFQSLEIRAGSNYDPKTTAYMINNNLNDYLVKSKYSKVSETALYQQNYDLSRGAE